MKSNSHILRSQNKPKCIKCGNIARSRCQYQSCKKCCAEAENPCDIHVLKANVTIVEKTPTPAPTPLDKFPSEPSSFGSAHGKAYIHQLFNIFNQFNNLQSPLCSRRPPNRKEAAVINEWRFRKLKEHKDRIAEEKDEAFDRYIKNVDLLEEVLAVNSTPDKLPNDMSATADGESMPVEPCSKTMLSALSLTLRSSPVRKENFRKRVQTIVDQGLNKIQKIELDTGKSESSNQNELVTKAGRLKSCSAERESLMNDLLDRLSKARNEDDLKSCLQIKSELFGGHEAKSMIQSEYAEVTNAGVGGKEIEQVSNYLPPRWMEAGNVDQDTLARIDSRFSSPEGIELL